ncbi:MAG: FecR family protein [Bacteriovoracaceae bacterium]|nr:FecR family protein [Bacteriovoracaceae bacterium]
MKYLIILFFAFSAFAADYKLDAESGVAIPNYMGELKMVKGVVGKLLQDKLKPVKVGTKFYQSDIIQTEENSFARLILADDTTLNLGPNSKLTFTEFTITKKTDRTFDFLLHRGQIRSQVKNEAKPGDLTIRTPMATMGIRGTELLINHRLIKDVGVSEFALISGEVEIKDFLNQDHSIIQGERVIIAGDKEKKSGASEKNKLTNTEWAQLANLDDLLPFFTPEGMPTTSPLHPVFYALNEAKVGEKSSKDQADLELVKKKPSTNENLKKLNEQLKDEYLKSQGN